MKIVFDYQAFALQSYGGISRYFVRLAQGLESLGEHVNVVAPLHRNCYLKDLPTTSVHGVGLKRFPAKTGRLALLANHYLGKSIISRMGADILHETYYSDKQISRVAKGSVITVYDMIHEKYADYFAWHDTITRKKRLAIDRVDRVICISQSTKSDLCALFDIAEEKVTVVHLGYERFATRSNTAAPFAKTGRPFLLYVGSRGGYKNFEAMLRAVASIPSLKNAFDVVAFGGGPLNDKERSLIRKLGFNSCAVRQLGGRDDLLGCLYAQARAFVYPSLYEGFGLPPLEAMAHDCPVVTSNSSSMPEVVGDAGEYFDPLDIDGQAHAIASVVFDDQRRSYLIEAGRQRLPLFSWDRCASETQAVYKQVLAAKGH
jgi:glycosyltransferase involved in cell wall biosynthesis